MGSPPAPRGLFWRLLLARPKLLAASIVLSLLVTTCQYLALTLFRLCIDSGARNGTFELFAYALAGYGGVKLSGAAASLGQGILQARVSRAVLADVRFSMFRHLLHLPRPAIQKATAGEIMARVMTDTGNTELLISATLAVGPASVFTLLAMLIYVAVSTGPAIAVLSLLPVAVSIWRFCRVDPIIQQTRREETDSADRVMSTLSESIEGIADIQGNGTFQDRFCRFWQASREHYRAGVKTLSTQSTFFVTNQLLMELPPFTVLALGGYFLFHPGSAMPWVSSTHLTVGAISAAYLALTQINAPIQGLIRLVMAYRSTRVSVTRIEEFLRQETMRVEGTTELPPAPEETSLDIRLDDVSVHLADGPVILRDVSATIGAGESVALVGPSGSGKTTVANLLCRAMEPSHGCIRFGGVDTRLLALDDILKEVSLVPQHGKIFSGSVFDNAVLGLRRAPLGPLVPVDASTPPAEPLVPRDLLPEVVAALRALHLGDLLALLGLEAPWGDLSASLPPEVRAGFEQVRTRARMRLDALEGGEADASQADVPADTARAAGASVLEVLAGKRGTTRAAQEIVLDELSRSPAVLDAVMTAGVTCPFGELSKRLSGGQAQRLVICRGLLKPARILVLDEATAALDTISQIKVLEFVRRAGEKRTIITVAHKLETVRHCDRILVLEDGRLVQEGTWQELESRDGLFHRLLGADARPSPPAPS